jgi:protein dithiol oxidoreductase (disulfide-forming)
MFLTKSDLQKPTKETRMKLIRSCLGLLLIGLSISIHAQTPPAQETLRPYLQVKPLPGEEDVVRVFFSPACSFSRQYIQFFKNLRSTLPKSKSLAMTPLPNTSDGLSYAASYIAVQKFYPDYLDNFIEASMIGVQDKGLSTRSWDAIERIGKAARLPTSLTKLVYQNQREIEIELNRIIRIRKHLNVVNTPAVAVSGTYIVTPEFTNGDSLQFNNLVSAVISMAM